MSETSTSTITSYSPYAAVGCTGITLQTTQDEYLSARTIEWGDFDLNSKLIVCAQEHSYTSRLPFEKNGLTWTNKYSFIGISVSVDDYIGEGINEKGLNAGLFYFKGFGSLAKFDSKHTMNTLVDMDVVRWLLSNFETVEEVQEHFEEITVAPVFIDEQGIPSPTAHWRVTDRFGGSIVIEIMNEGEVFIHKNTVGVITNAPDFKWHLTNLSNYITLQPGTVKPAKVGDQLVSSLSLGTAALGLPGDYTSASRFIRAAYLRNTVPQLKSASAAVSQAFHILNNFDIPIGTEYSWSNRDSIPDLASATQWTAVSDLSNQIFYYKTMHDSTVRRITLSSVQFIKGKQTTYPLDSGSFTVSDVTPSQY